MLQVFGRLELVADHYLGHVQKLMKVLANCVTLAGEISVLDEAISAEGLWIVAQ